MPVKYLLAISYVAMKKINFTLAFLLLTFVSALAQEGDTLLNFQQAKARLIKQNLSLLAAFYDIDISEARLIQSKLWNNPYFIWNQELYNVEKNQYFNYQNQFLAQVEQIFSVAGKHTNTVKLAKINVAINKMQFEDVMRSLLFDLGSTYNNLAALQTKEKLYNSVLRSYDQLMVATREQLRVGSISMAESIRLESEYKAVKTQAVENANQKENALSQLRVLLKFPSDSALNVQLELPLTVPALQRDTLVYHALKDRPDLKVMVLNREYQSRNVKLQKSLSVPDIKFGYQPTDKGSNYTRPYSGFNVEMPLPLFDRNQGRILEAKLTLKQSYFELELHKIKVINEVIAAFNRFQRTNEGLQLYSTDFIERVRTLNQNVNQNFQRRNISLLEFIDQQRIYITTNLQWIDLKQLYLDSINDLNFSTGSQLIEN
jgi:cobalt-zinc-cadmium efflux system outer membrane protein